MNTIDANSMLMEMNAMRMQARGIEAYNSKAVVESSQNSSGSDFATMLKGAIDNVNEMQHHSNTLKTNFELGDRSVSLAEVMIASQKAGIGLEATIQVRNKMVEAYKTIMQMQL